jgi:hypothetical protein
MLKLQFSSFSGPGAIQLPYWCFSVMGACTDTAKSIFTPAPLPETSGA